MNNIYTGRTEYFEVQIFPNPLNLKTTDVKFRILKGQKLILEIEPQSLISDDTVSFALDNVLTKNLDEGIYIYEILYTFENATEQVLNGTINILRRK